MGICIKGDPRQEILFKPKEIAEAMKWPVGRVHSIRKELEIPSSVKGYTYEEIKRMVTYKPIKSLTPEQRTEILLEKLRKDGFA